MLRYLLLVCAFLPLACYADVSRVATGIESTTTAFDNANPLTEASFVMPAGTDAVLVSIGFSSLTESGNTSVTWNTSESLALTEATTTSGSSSDVAIQTWCLMSPTATTANMVGSTNRSPGVVVAAWMITVALDGVDAGTCAEVVTELQEVVDNTGAASSAAFASAGTDAGIVVCTVAGDDASPMSNDASFTEIHDTNTGGGATNAADLAIYMAEKLTGLPSAVTVTFSAADESACQYLGIAAASVSSTLTRRRRMMQDQL